MDYNDEEKRLIAALVKKNREINLLEMKNDLYTMFLTPEQKRAADLYAEECIKTRRSAYDAT